VLFVLPTFTSRRVTDAISFIAHAIRVILLASAMAATLVCRLRNDLFAAGGEE
jgi:hypothetical protein